MHLIYYDESGDDGFPNYSSPLFVLTATYLHDSNWRDGFNALREFRRWANKEHGIPIKMEIHAKDFLLNKNLYRKLKISDDNRIAVIQRYSEEISRLPTRRILCLHPADIGGN